MTQTSPLEPSALKRPSPFMAVQWNLPLSSTVPLTVKYSKALSLE